MHVQHFSEFFIICDIPLNYSLGDKNNSLCGENFGIQLQIFKHNRFGIFFYVFKFEILMFMFQINIKVQFAVSFRVEKKIFCFLGTPAKGESVSGALTSLYKVLPSCLNCDSVTFECYFLPSGDTYHNNFNMR